MRQMITLNNKIIQRRIKDINIIYKKVHKFSSKAILYQLMQSITNKYY